jgi:hypothetical protein
MGINRRALIKSAAGLVLAGTGGLLLPERRVWALDRTMLPPGWFDARMDAFEKGTGGVWLDGVFYPVSMPDYPFIRARDAWGLPLWKA